MRVEASAQFKEDLRMNLPFSKGFTALIFATAISLLLPSGAASDDMSDSSECVACHTDLEEMDDYGAEAASAAAAVAG